MKLLIAFILLNVAFFKKEIKEEIMKKIQEYSEKGDLGQEEISTFLNIPKTKFESFEINNNQEQDTIKVSMIVEKTGKYQVNCKETMIWIYNSNGELISTSEENDKIFILKDSIIYAQFIHFGTLETIKVNINHLSNYNLPFDPINIKDESEFDTSPIKTDPLKDYYAEIKYQKRQGNYLYINSNNPEEIHDNHINKAYIRLDISNKEVFFTYEHNTMKIDYTIYSGFQVRNTGTTNLQVKIKNIGFQYNGSDAWLGQKEWTDFYGVQFEVKNMDKYSKSQRANFDREFGFKEFYDPTPFQTRTYTIPPEEYFYVIGGTTDDAYGNYNVFNTANIDVKKTCINGVVLFEVIGNAEGAYFVYNDINIPQTDRESYQGYLLESSRVYVGYDNCNGVIDNSMTWEFNDLSKGQFLPVTAKLLWNENAPTYKQKPFSKIETKEYTYVGNFWLTHLNTFETYRKSKTNVTIPVGMDMTKFITINENKEDIIIDTEHYDGSGNISNLGNWMIGYIDNFNFVNRGNKQRKISILLSHAFKGSLACFILNSKLEIIPGTEQNTIKCPKSDKGFEEIDNGLVYDLTVEPHSVTQIYLEYTNLANSCGNVTHFVYLHGVESDNNIGTKMKVSSLNIFFLLAAIILF